MPRVFDEYMVSLTRNLQDFFGYADTYAATYTASNGSVTIEVFLQYDFFEQVAGYDATVPKREKTVQAIKTDLGSLLYDGYFEIDGTNYHIRDVSDDDGHQIAFKVST